MKSDFDVLIVDDFHLVRDATKILLESMSTKLGLDQNKIKYAANPAQAKAYFNENRDKARDLLLISDERMDNPKKQTNLYEDTSYDLPQTITEDQNFETMKKLTQEWCKQTNNRCFIVLRSNSTDIKTTPLEEISRGSNNFDNPVKISKVTPFGDYFEAIFNHCKKLFSLPANSAQALA